MTAIEEGTTLEIDFGKLTAIGRAGLQVVPVVLQDADTGDVLFVGYANREALQTSLATRTAVLWSTSRNELWHKGASSGDVLDLVDIRVNCEQNSLLYRVRPRKGVCHTRDASGNTRAGCYYRVIEGDGPSLRFVDPAGGAGARKPEPERVG